MHLGSIRDGVIGYVGSIYAGDVNKRSLTAYISTIGGCTTSWKVKLQSTVALFITETEYVEIPETCKEAIWFKGLLGELSDDMKMTKVFCASQSAIFSLNIRCFMRGQSILICVITMCMILLLMVI